MLSLARTGGAAQGGSGATGRGWGGAAVGPLHGGPLRGGPGQQWRGGAGWGAMPLRSGLRLEDQSSQPWTIFKHASGVIVS